MKHEFRKPMEWRRDRRAYLPDSYLSHDGDYRIVPKSVYGRRLGWQLQKTDDTETLVGQMQSTIAKCKDLAEQDKWGAPVDKTYTFLELQRIILNSAGSFTGQESQHFVEHLLDVLRPKPVEF